MCKEKICRVPDVTHEQWLDYRKTGIGGSDSSTVAGLNPYSSLYVLYNDKLGLLAPKEDNEAMRVGRDLEAYVAQRWMEATGKKVQRNNFMWRSTDHPFMLADIDREVIGENAALECKTASAYTKTDWANGEIQPNYYTQCQHYMAVMGYDRMYLAVLVMGKGFYHFTIERNEEDIAALISMESEFWYGNVLQNVPPMLDGSDATLDLLRKNNPTSTPGFDIELDSACEKLLSELESVQDSINTLKDKENALKAKIMAYMSDAEKGHVGCWSVSYKTQTSSRLNSSKVKKLLTADQYKACCTESQSRPFKVTKKEV